MNDRLKAARLKKGWSQEDAAEAAGVAPRTYQRWESGGARPNFESRKLLREAFEATDGELGVLLAGMSVVSDSEPTQEGEIAFRLSYEEAVAFHDALVLLGEGFMAHFSPSRRKALEAALKAAGMLTAAPPLLNPEPWERLVKPVLMNNDAIQHFDRLLDTCRALSNGSELLVAERLLGTFLPRLQEAAPYQPAVAGLAAQGLFLKSIFSAHDLHIDTKIGLCQMAIERAKQSANPNLIAAGYLQLGVAFHYAQQHENALKVQQEALYYASQASPLVQSHIYTEIAPTLAQFARRREADFYIHLAYEVFPEHPEQDPSFAFDDHGLFNLGLYKGIMYIHLTQPKAAWDAFEEYKSPTVPERMRLEMVNHQGKAAVFAQDLDRYEQCLKDGLAGAVALKSKKRFDEALTIFRQDVPSSWYKEPQLKTLIEQYQLLLPGA